MPSIPVRNVVSSRPAAVPHAAVRATAHKPRHAAAHAASSDSASPEKSAFVPGRAPSKNIKIDAGHGRETPWYTTMPKFYQRPRADFPFTYDLAASEAPKSLAELAPQIRAIVDEKLPINGAVLFRALPIATGEQFTELMEAVGYKSIHFQGILVRRFKQGGDTTYNVSTEPPSLVLVPHNEAMAEPALTNDKIIFGCLKPAPIGGESLLVSTRELTQDVGQETIDLFEKNGGVRYERWYPSKDSGAKAGEFVLPSWQEWTHTDDRETAQKHFMKLGWKADELHWDADGGLHVIHTRPAMQRIGDEDLWLNIANLKGYGEGFKMSFGNGEPIPEKTREHLSNIRWFNAVAFPLEPGDVIFIDNFRALHGRTPYENTAEQERTLVSYMTLG